MEWSAPQCVCVKFVPGPGPVSPPCGTYYGTFTYTALGPSSTSGPFLLRVRLVCSGWVRARPACSRSSMRLRGRVTCMYVWMYVRCEMGGCCVRCLSPCQGLGPLCPASQCQGCVHMCICIYMHMHMHSPVRWRCPCVCASLTCHAYYALLSRLMYHAHMTCQHMRVRMPP